MEKSLKTLEQHNSERLQQTMILNDNTPKRNGIACPMCSTELFDTNPMITLTSIPAKKDIHCGYCDYRGYRYA